MTDFLQRYPPIPAVLLRELRPFPDGAMSQPSQTRGFVALCQKSKNRRTNTSSAASPFGIVTYVREAASRINCEIVSGCEIRDRWLASTSIVLAPIRFAMNRSRSGLIVRSSVETA
jgi:hypothetical protein